MKVAILYDKNNNWILKYLSKKKIEGINGKNIKLTIGHNIKKFNGYEILFILGYTKKINNDDLLRNKINLVIHASDLPKDRGFSPIQYQILRGKNKFKVSLITVEEEIDSGLIILQKDLNFDGTELYDEIRKKTAEITTKIILDFLIRYPAILNNKIKQKGRATFNKKLTDKNNELNIYRSINKQFNILRIGNNEKWPSHFYRKGIRYIIKIYKDNLEKT